MGVQIQFVADDPNDHGWMVLVSQNFRLHSFQLARNCGFIVVIKTVAFQTKIKPHGYIKMVLQGAVEHLPAGFTTATCSPCAK